MKKSLNKIITARFRPWFERSQQNPWCKCPRILVRSIPKPSSIRANRWYLVQCEAEWEVAAHFDNAAKQLKTAAHIHCLPSRDFFHPDIPEMWKLEVLGLVRGFSNLIWHFSTKFTHEAALYMQEYGWPKNMWIGAIVQNKEDLQRLHHLREMPAPVRFIALNTFAEDITLDLTGIDWVVADGDLESETILPDDPRVTKIKKQCKAAGIPFLFKPAHDSEAWESQNFPTPKPERLALEKEAATDKVKPKAKGTKPKLVVKRK